MTQPLRVAVAEDEALYRELLVTSIIARLPDVSVVGSYGSAEELAAKTKPQDIDVLLTDLDLGQGADGTRLGIHLRRRNPKLGVVLLSNLTMPALIAGLPEDVRGGWSYLLKTSVSDLDQLGLAIRQSAAGGMVIDPALTRKLVPESSGPVSKLTPRQLDVIARMANGWSNKRIAEDLVISVRTVESVVSDILVALAIPKDTEGYNARVACVLAYLKNTVVFDQDMQGDSLDP